MSNRRRNAYFRREVKFLRRRPCFDAGKDARGTALFTLAHEVTHYIREWSPAKFEEISDFVGERMGADMEGLMTRKAELLRKMPQFKDKTVTELNDAAHEEVIADAMETILSDGTVMEDLATYDKSIWEKIKSWIIDVIEKIKAAYAELSPNSQAAKVLKETVDDMSELQRLWTEGVKEAGERTRTAEAEKTSEGIVKYKTANENNDSSIKDQLKENARRIASMDPVASVLYTSMNKKQLHERVSEDFKKIGYKVDRKDFGVIEIGERQIDKSINYINTEGEKAALLAIPSVLKRGEIISGHDNHKGREYDTVTIAAPIEVNGNRGIVGAVVTKIEGKNKYRVHRILTPDGSEFVFDTQKTNAELTSGEPSSRDKRAPIGSASDSSISRPDGKVKRKYSISDNSLVEKYPNLDLNQDISDMDGVPAIQLEDGSVLTFTEPHVTFIQNNDIDVEDIRSGGWIADGVYEPSERSDTLRYKERMLAKKRMDEKRAAKKGDIRYSIDETDETLAPFAAAEARTEAEAAARAEAKTKAQTETEGDEIQDVYEIEDETPLEAAARRMREREAEERGDVWTLEDESRRRQAIRDHELLADALMETAQSESEYRTVKRYKEKVKEIADAESRITELRKKTAELNREMDSLREKIKGVEKSKREVWVMTALDETTVHLKGFHKVDSVIIPIGYTA